MSSNIKVVRICNYCNKEFIARTTVTQCCSDHCAKRFYKLKIKNEKIAQAELETAVKKTPKAYVTEEQIRLIKAKQYLTLKEAALLLNIFALHFKELDFRWKDVL